MKFDIAVIGGGPGGYVAAIKAAQSGISTCLIEKEKVGGTCLNVGCIPTKYLLTNSKRYADLFSYSNYGIEVDVLDVDFVKMIEGKNKVINKLTSGVEYLLKKNKAVLIKGEASFVSKNVLNVSSERGDEEVYAEKIIIATGSSPFIPNNFGYDGEKVCSSTEALEWKEVPDSILIIGGGVIGCELANIYSNLGAAVTIVEMQNRIVPMMDKDLSNFLSNLFEINGIQLLTRVTVESINKNCPNPIIELSNGETIEVNKVIVSIGRKTRLEALNLEILNMEHEKGRILVDDQMKTNVENVYSVGDVCSSPYDLAHTAMKEGIIAVENILGQDAAMKYNSVPNCIYTFPEISTVGLTLDQAENEGLEVEIGKFNFAANGKALSMDETEGFVKIVAEKSTGIVLGAQMAGPHVTDMIVQIASAIDNKLTVDQLKSTIYPHPTLSETIFEALEGVFGMAIHS